MSKKRKVDEQEDKKAEKEAPPAYAEVEKPRKFWGMVTLRIEHIPYRTETHSAGFPAFAKSKNELLNWFKLEAVHTYKRAGILDEKTINAVIAPLELGQHSFSLRQSKWVHDKVFAHLANGGLPKSIKETIANAFGFEVTETGLIPLDVTKIDV